MISASEFKTHCLALLDEVHRTGKPLVISKRGKPIARLVPELEERSWEKLRGTGFLLGDPFEPVISEKDISSLQSKD